MKTEEGEEMKIGLTWDKFVDVAKGTWHLVGLLVVLIWFIASYKVGLDMHLNIIDEHLKMEDDKLNWIINHQPDPSDPSLTNPRRFVPQKKKVEPHSLLTMPGLLEASDAHEAPQDAQIPPLAR